MKRAACIALLVAACTRESSLFVPLDDQARGGVLAVETGSGLRVYGLESPASSLTITGEEVVEVTVIYFDVTLGELMLPVGLIEEAGPSQRSRPLPVHRSVVVVRPGETPRTELDPEAPVSKFRFPAFDPKRCAEGGGCLSGAAEPRCWTPCPVPADPVAPNAPMVAVGAIVPPEPGACPPGWSREDDPLCTPPSLPPPVPCAAGAAQHFGAAGCSPIGAACPAGDWSGSLPAQGAIRHVATGAAPGGDGSITAPFATIAEALAAGGVLDVIALGRGTHAGDLAVAGPLRIAGVCAEATSIAGALTATAGRLELDGLSIDNTLDVGAGAEVRVDGVVITGSGVDVRPLGVLAARDTLVRDLSNAVRVEVGGDATFDDVVLQATSLNVCGMARLRRVAVRGGGRVQVTCAEAVLDAASVQIERAPDAALALQAGTALLAGVHVAAAGAEGLYAHGEASVAARGLSLQGTIGAGLRAADGAVLDVEHGAIGDVEPRPGATALGVMLENGRGSNRLAHVVVAGVPGFGVWLDAATATVADVWIRDVSSGGGAAGALSLTASSDLVLERARIERVAGTGVTVDEASVAELRETSIDGVSADESGAAPAGVRVASGGSAFVQGLRVANIIGLGVDVQTGSVSGARVAIEDMPAPGGEGTASWGVHVASGSLELDGLEIRRVDGLALWVNGSAVLRDVRIADISGGTILGWTGLVPAVRVGGEDGVVVQRAVIEAADRPAMVLAETRGALLTDLQVTGGHVLFEGSASAAVERARITGAGIDASTSADVTASDLVIDEARTTGGYGGNAVTVREGARVDLERFALRRAQVSGIFVQGAANGDEEAVDLADGSVEDSPVGVLLQIRDYDLARLLERVRYTGTLSVFEVQ